MSALIENEELYGYLQQNYSTTHYRFERLFGHSFPYKKLDLSSIKELKLKGISNLSGIEELKGLEKIEVSDVADLSPLEKCSNLTVVKCHLPDQPVDVESLKRISSLESIQKAEFYGRGVKSISSDQAMQFGETSRLSYDELAQLTPEQFSKVQSRLSEVQSLITPEMTDVEKVESIYRNLLPQNFEYDYSNHFTGSNGYLINNTMYGPLVENKGVCSGIASALEHALKNTGLDAVSCGGWANTHPTAGDSHQWNQVKVDGEWYNLDLTNDYDKKSWRFFMKSDKDYDWAECHYADKEDKYEPVHECTSTKYDEVYREDPKERELRELGKQREALIQQKINTPLSEIDNPDYVEYRNKVNGILEQSSEEEYIRSQFTMYKNQDGQDRCYHTLQSAKRDQPVQTLMSNDFEYSEKFRKGMLEPSVKDFSQRGPISSATVSSSVTENSNPSISQQQAGVTNSAHQQTSNVNLMSENNNMMQINNIDTTYAQQIQQQAPQIAPDVYMQQQAQIAAQQMTQAGPQLTLTMGGMGFVNTLLIAVLSGLVIGILIIFGLYLFK